MSTYLIELETEIANLEDRIIQQRAVVASTPAHKRGHNSRKARAAVLADLQAKHERLVMQVQRATVGAVKAGQVA